ncbi:MAG: CheR family methyltransferase, partial [Bdellovibrionia bacterium]
MRQRAAGFSNDETRLHDLLQVVTLETGIVFGPKDSTMVQSRLTRRAREAGFRTLSDYLEFFSSNKAAETPFVVSLLTTHHTYFFREYSLFEYLETDALDTVIKNVRAQGRRTISVWSSACSHGQEAYSLAMFFNYHLKRRAPDLTIKIYGSDICTDSVRRAKNGVYKWDELKRAPALFTDGNWIRGEGEISHFVKAGRGLREVCEFGVVNLNEIDKGLGSEKFDLIVCRNVFIYFSIQKVEEITKQMIERLHPGGLLSVGLSETLTGLALPVTCVGPSVYASDKFAPVEKTKIKRLVRVMCVDDSPTVIAILKRLLTPEHGFEIVATAASAEEAEELAPKTKFDVMTLDIHMPGRSGIDYLARQAGRTHPPIIMVSSVSQSDSDLALRALDLGARDYVEKPELANLHRVGDEIRAKLRCAFNDIPNFDVTHSFKAPVSIKNTADRLRVIVAGAGDTRKIQRILNSLDGKQPATVLLFHGPAELAETMVTRLNLSAWKNSKAAPIDGDLEEQHVYFSSFEKGFPKLRDEHRRAKWSVLF